MGRNQERKAVNRFLSAARKWLGWDAEEKPEEFFVTLHELYESVLILGSIGSGKSSGPGSAVIRYLLEQGAGVLWLCAKDTEYEDALRICAQKGRASDVINFCPGEHCFNFLGYALNSPGGVEAANDLQKKMIEYLSQSSGQGKDPFWPMSAGQLNSAATTIIHAAQGTATPLDQYKFLTDLPNTPDAIKTPEWKNSFCGTAVAMAVAKQGVDKLQIQLEHILESWPLMAPQTRQGVLAVAMNSIIPLTTGTVGPMVSGSSTVTPDALFDGAIIVVNVPTLKYQISGRLLQVAWKAATQQAVLRRNLAVNSRPIVIFSDEYQEFCIGGVGGDGAVQAVGRSKKLIHVALTQNLNLLRDALGGDESAMLGQVANFNTKIFCNNSCPDTNEYASSLCGNERTPFFSGTAGDYKSYDLFDDVMGNAKTGTNISWNEQNFPACPPEVYTRLAKGGQTYGYLVEAICCQAGKPWRKEVFRQKID